MAEPNGSTGDDPENGPADPRGEPVNPADDALPQAASETAAAPAGDGSAASAEPRAEPIFNLPPVVMGAIGICVALYGLQELVLSDRQYYWLLSSAAFIPVRYSGQFAMDVFAFTAPFTYSVLHGSLAHLGVNMVWLAAFGSPTANRIGGVKFVLFWLFTAGAAAALHYAVHPIDQSPLVGASGAISGMMGAAARFGFRIDRRGDRPGFSGYPWPITACLRSRSVLTFLAVWMVVNLVVGLVGLGGDMTIAWEAHVGGFLAGFLGIGLFTGSPPREPRSMRKRRRQQQA